MSYKYNKKEANGEVLMPENDYEVRIEEMERRTTQSGKDCVSVKFRVRSDVEQSFKNKYIFESIWKDTENPNLFNTKRINKLLGTQKIEDGREFETINDVINFLTGCYLFVHIAIEYDEYNDKDRNVVKYYGKTRVAPNTLTANTVSATQNPAPQANNIVMPTDELPF